MSHLPKDDDYPEVVGQEAPSKPRLHLAVPYKEVGKRDIGDAVTVTLKGKIIGLDMQKGKKSSRASIELEDPDIKVTLKDNEFGKLADDE
jgi:hypothetical protein